MSYVGAFCLESMLVFPTSCFCVQIQESLQKLVVQAHAEPWSRWLRRRWQLLRILGWWRGTVVMVKASLFFPQAGFECCVRLAGLCVFETFPAGRAETKNIQILCAIPAAVGFSGGVVFLPVSQKWTSTHEKWLRVFQKVGQKHAPSTHFMTFKGSNAVRLVLGFVKLFTPPKFNSSPLKNATFLLGSR